MSNGEGQCVLLARFSPRRDAQDCPSCERQLEDLREWAQRMGRKVRSEFSDPDTSGRDWFRIRFKRGTCQRGQREIKALRVTTDIEERDGLVAALEALQPGDYLVVRDVDRLSREPELASVYLKIIESKGAQLATLGGGDPSDSPEAQFQRDILFAVARYQRRVAADRTSRRMRQHQKNGRKTGRFCPIGYRVGPEEVETLPSGKVVRHTSLLPDTDEQAICARMLEMHSEGLTPSQIATRLTKEGVKCRGRRVWKESVAALLERQRTQ